MSEQILFVADNLPRAQFFARFASAGRKQNVSCRYLTYRRSAHRYLLKRGLDSHILTPKSEPQDLAFGEFDDVCLQAQEVIRREATVKAVRRSVVGLAAGIQRTIDQYAPSHVCMWNGAQLIERLVARLCGDGIEKRFFEIANIPGKLVVDSAGVNASSSLYTAPENLLVHGVPDDHEYQQWRRGYLDRFTGVVPQAKAAHAMQWERPADAMASRLGIGFYPIGLQQMLARFLGKVVNSSQVSELVQKYRFSMETECPYCFFPLQVSDDTQLLLNSDLGNIEALKRVHARCREDGMDLVVKIHPAENNRKALLELDALLTELASRGGIYLTELPTNILIHGAEKVYTINSTVGLETLICDRPLEVLGRTFFQSFIGREDLLKCYLLRYLVPFDYFSDKEADSSLLARILGGWPDGGSPDGGSLVGRSLGDTGHGLRSTETNAVVPTQ